MRRVWNCSLAIWACWPLPSRCGAEAIAPERQRGDWSDACRGVGDGGDIRQGITDGRRR